MGVCGAFRLFFLNCIFFFSIVAGAAPFHGLPYEVHHVESADGADLKLYEIKSDGGGAVIEFKLGFDQAAEAVDDRILEHVRRGDKVFIGQVRHAGRGENRSTGAVPADLAIDGLEQVIKFDGPALTREVIKRAGGRPVHGIGYSMGVIQFVGMATDPNLAREFYPRVSSLTLIAGPTDFKNLPRRVKLAASVLLPVFKKIRSISKSQTIDWTVIYDYTQKLKQSGNPIKAASARAIEGAAIQLGNFVLQMILSDTKHLSPKAQRRLWLKDTSPLPLDLLITIAEAAVSRDGEIRDKLGRLLARPEAITVPTQVVRGTADILAPMKQQQELYERLSSKTKQLVTLENLKHVTITHGDGALLETMDKVIADFIANPDNAVRTHNRELVLREAGFCEKLLTAFRMPLMRRSSN